MPDKLNYIKNMMWMMCCDGKIADREVKFLKKAAKEVSAEIDDWKMLLKEVKSSGPQVYPINNREKAVAALKSLVIMAKVDGKIDAQEKEYLLKFAKSIGISNQQWVDLRKNIDLETLFDAFKEPCSESMNLGGGIVAIRDDFDKIDEFADVASDFGAAVDFAGYKEFVTAPAVDGQIVCFHAAQDKKETVRRCANIMKKAGGNMAAILTRYQGHQVQYMLEIGLEKCIIEPVYTQDIIKLLK